MGLLDNLPGFRPKKPSATESVGVPGTAIYGGYVQTRETEASVAGLNRYRTYDSILLNVDIVGAGVRYFLNLLGGATWVFRPSDEQDSRSVELAELTEDIFFDMDRTLPTIVKRTGMYRMYGFSVQEWVAKKREDGVIGFKNISPRPQHTIEQWARNDDGDIEWVIQRSPQDGQAIPLPRGKLVYIVDESLSDSPEGMGLFRQIVPHANRLTTYEKLEGIGFETDLRGTPKGRAPIAALQRAVDNAELTQETADKLLGDFTNFIQNHYRSAETGVVLDSDVYTTDDAKKTPTSTPLWDLEIFRGDSGALPDVAAAIVRKTHSIARTLGVEHLLLGGEGRGGSFALSKDKTNNFFLSVNSALEEIAQVYERDLLEPLWALNGWDRELMPSISYEPVQFKDVEQVTKAILDLANAGAPLDPEDEIVNEVRELVGMPAAPEMAARLDALLPREPEPPIVAKPEEEVPEDGRSDRDE